MNNPILEIKNLTKIYDKKQNVGIKNISFNVNRGKFHAFIGENGAGKTTTIKSIIGAYTNLDGEILINGISHKKAESKKIVGYVPENPIFPKEITTYEYLLALSLLTNIPRNEINQKIEEFLKKFNILNLKNKKPSSFSSGQKKKILLIQALIHNPELIILDEPAANLDPSARFELFSILKQLIDNGKTIFISSHILSEIDEFTTEVTLIDNGSIVYSGPKYKHLGEMFYEKIIKK
ncbi:ABC transporter ATP-binding protein [Metamycoplasma cloacale]|uniref:ABC transporter ATP-binding protein n=1 Tax=Metamycoplasma cloacale TaxID=92401 RepID=A0A2Z4LM68_9BACT|nr:ABC transporter ATP-binding protein [Metamycoplasma cloacale]AWX42855.1 ABC transporter ATP-binding protein [Metamycoplasma cloacale]VEU79323.1 ABC transporter ATP-binding protein [Metamycoplasma cloacale]